MVDETQEAQTTDTVPAPEVIARRLASAEAAPVVPLFYANCSRNYGGAFDVTFEFGHQRGDDDPTWVAAVAMSWEHAKAFAESLDRMLTEFQAHAGPLPTPHQAASTEGGSHD